MRTGSQHGRQWVAVLPARMRRDADLVGHTHAEEAIVRDDTRVRLPAVDQERQRLSFGELDDPIKLFDPVIVLDLQPQPAARERGFILAEVVLRAFDGEHCAQRLARCTSNGIKGGGTAASVLSDGPCAVLAVVVAKAAVVRREALTNGSRRGQPRPVCELCLVHFELW